MVVEVRPRFEKELKRTPQPIQNEVKKVLLTLVASNSLAESGLAFKKMKGQRKTDSFYRIRIGDWRLGIQYLHPNVVVITILKRGDVYKHFPPR